MSNPKFADSLDSKLAAEPRADLLYVRIILCDGSISTDCTAVVALARPPSMPPSGGRRSLVRRARVPRQRTINFRCHIITCRSQSQSRAWFTSGRGAGGGRDFKEPEGGECEREGKTRPLSDAPAVSFESKSSG